MMRSIRVPRVALALLLGAALSACASSTSINRILAEPQRYANRDVRVTGRVLTSASVLGRGAYQIDDGSGTLWVVSERGVPRKGARVRVTGKVRDAFDLGTIVKLPEVTANGLVLMETEHRAKD
jgi:hypothetical protein